jgi:hypothetical protein
MLRTAAGVRSHGVRRIVRRHGGGGPVGRRRARLGIGLSVILGVVVATMATGLLLPQRAVAAPPPTGPLLWNIVSSPNAPGSSGSSSSTLYGVACPSSSDCWAVGTGANQTLIEQFTPSGWAIVPSPALPTGSTYGLLNAVTCVSAADCWAVGYTLDAGGDQVVLIEQDTGSGWSIVPEPSGSTQGQLYGVTCVTAADCWAVGDYVDSVGVWSLAEQFNGTPPSWAVVPSPNPNGSTYTYLDAIDCVSADDCWAVGGSETASHGASLVEQYDGPVTGWNPVTSLNPAGASQSWFSGVACGATTCWAAGSYEDAEGNEYVLIEGYAGTDWTIASAPDPPGSEEDFDGITCLSDSDCWAAGHYIGTATTDYQTFVEQYSGTQWSMVSTPNPAASTGSGLQGVTCASASLCFAIGYTSVGTLIEQTYEAGAGAYTPLQPFRVCDTRAGTETECSSGGALGQGQSMTLQVSGVDGPESQSVPTDALAVVLNVTGISGTLGTFLTAYPAGAAVPTASNLNLNAQTNQANLVVVPLGSNGQVSLYNSLGSINVAVDVEGYFAAPSGSSPVGLFHPIPPLRICDTRAGQPANVCNNGGVGPSLPLGAGQWTKVVVSGCPTGDPSCTASIPNDSTALAVALNLTAVSGTASTYLSVVPPSSGDACPTGAPPSSNLNVDAQTNLPNRVIVPLGPSQDVCVYNSLGSINFILDVNGWFGNGAETSTGAYFYAVSPLRICDTRSAAAVGYVTECSGSSIGPGAVLPVQVAGVDGITGTGGTTPPVAVIANVTAVSGSAFTYFTLYPSDVSQPNASDLNVGPQQNTPNLCIVQLATAGGSAGRLDIFNDRGTINAIVDVAGWFQT